MPVTGRWLLLAHIMSVVVALSGLIGRELVRLRARRTAQVDQFAVLIQLTDRFDRLLAIPGSFLLLLTGLLLAWHGGWPLLGGPSAYWLPVSVILYLAVYPLVVFIFVPRGKRFEAALQDAVAQARMTPELDAAVRDKTVTVAHWIEAGLVIAILVLMVVKPF